MIGLVFLIPLTYNINSQINLKIIMNLKLYKTLSYFFSLIFILNSSACFRHSVRKEVHEKILKNDLNICKDPINFLNKFPHASTFYAASKCYKEEHSNRDSARCKILILAADCGHKQAEIELNKIPECYLNGRKRKYPSDDETFTTVLADLNKRAPECGYTTKITPIGYALIPFGVIIGAPLFIVLWPVVCLIPSNKPDSCSYQF
jgi:hypothetical protein